MACTHILGWSRFVLPLLAAALILPACGDDDDGPSGLECVGEKCNLKCPADDPSCQATCRNGADCDLDCNGTECDLDCKAKSTCVADCSERGGCDTNCQGQSTCTVNCEQAGNCNLDCAGGSECTTTCKENCGGGCAGNSSCNLGCEQNCGIGCTGNTTCGLSCKTGCYICCQGSATCNLTCSDAEVTECPGDDNTKIYVCGRECPPASECRYENAVSTETPPPSPQ